MFRFRQFLKEVKLPKNADLETVKGDNYSNAEGLPKLTDEENAFWSEYITDLDNWISGGGADQIQDWKDKIPKKYRQGGLMYRGLSWDMDWDVKLIDEVGLILKKGFTAFGLESWTRDFKQGKEFALYNQYHDEVTIGFTIQKKIPTSEVIADVKKITFDREMVKIGAAATKDVFHNRIAAKMENEVIVARGSTKNMKLTDKTFAFGQVKGYGTTKLKKFIQMVKEYKDSM